MKLWEDLGLPYMVVSTEPQVFAFLAVGGHALIEKALGEQTFPFLASATPYRPYGMAGFVSIGGLAKDATSRAPSRGLRMRIIKRDEFRCRICGRRPADYVDVELHVHHIRPWGAGGMTVEDNLVTLCGTCHAGLEPHFETSLFELIGTTRGTVQDYVAKHLDGVMRYRALAKRVHEGEL